MKKLIAILMAAALMGCDSQKPIGNKTVDYYGLANEGSAKDVCYKYELSFWNTVGAIIFSETVIIPVYVVGWALMEPVKKIPDCVSNGSN